MGHSLQAWKTTVDLSLSESLRPLQGHGRSVLSLAPPCSQKPPPRPVLHTQAAETLPRGAGHPRCLLTVHPLPMGLTGSPGRVRAVAPQRLPQMAGLLVPGAGNAPAFTPSLWNWLMGPCCIPGRCGVRTGVPMHLGLGCFFTVATSGTQRCRFRHGFKCWHSWVCAPRKPPQGLGSPSPALGTPVGAGGSSPAPANSSRWVIWLMWLCPPKMRAAQALLPSLPEWCTAKYRTHCPNPVSSGLRIKRKLFCSPVPKMSLLPAED